MPDARPRAPDNLAARGRRLWRQVVADYVLRADELMLLEEACRTADVIEELRTRTDDPDYRELRLQRALLSQLLGRLGFVDDAGRADTPKTRRARKAADARWRDDG